MSVLMTLSDPNSGFKVTVLYTSRISQKPLGLRESYRKPYTIYRMVPLSMTLIDPLPGFQGRDIFRH